MKKTLIAAAASVFFVVACGDDSSSNASGESPTESLNTITKIGRYQIDESENLLILISESTGNYSCITNGENFTWEYSAPETYSDTAKYEFRGDSLILHAFRYGHKSLLEEVYMGGKPGKFEGTWSLHCYIFHSRDDLQQCFEPPVFSFTFSDGKLTQTTNLDSILKLDDDLDFMSSRFMVDLYSGMNPGGLDIKEKDLFTTDSSGIQRAIKEYKINIKKSNKTSQVFEMNGKTFTINVKKATRTIRDGLINPSVNGFDFETFNEIQLELSDGTTTCKLNYSEKLVDKDLCHGEKSEFLVTYVLKNNRGETMRDSEGNEIESATLYRDTGNDSFSECFLKMNLD